MIAERVNEVEKQQIPPEDKLLAFFLAMKIEDQMEEGLLEEMQRESSIANIQSSICRYFLRQRSHC